MRKWLAAALYRAAKFVDNNDDISSAVSNDKMDPDIPMSLLKFVHSECKDKISRLDAYGSRLDTKAAGLQGFVSGVSLFLAPQPAEGLLKGVAFLLLAVSPIFSFLTMAVREYKDAPHPPQLVAETNKFSGLDKERAEALVLAVQIDAQVIAFESRAKKGRRKPQYWRWSLIFFALSVAMTVVTVALGE